MINTSQSIEGGGAQTVFVSPLLALNARFFAMNRSLTGKRTCVLIRPFMSLNRTDTRRLCRFWELPVYPDVTNQEVAFSRNRIRKQLLPTLKLLFNRQVDRVLSQSAEILLHERLQTNLLVSKPPQACKAQEGGRNGMSLAGTRPPRLWRHPRSHGDKHHKPLRWPGVANEPLAPFDAATDHPDGVWSTKPLPMETSHRAMGGP
jgi:hypothetical protein